MKTALFTLLILVLCASSLAACQAGAQPVKIGEADAGQTITLNTGDMLQVELAGNLTTGYNWIPAAQAPPLLEQVGEAAVTPEGDQLGAPGMIMLRFKAIAQGQTVLRLEYKRAWETGVAPEKTFEVTVVVK
jgi:inhibitor of cysteine peptidase